MNALPISVATSAGVNGPSPPKRSAASVGDLGEQLVPALTASTAAFGGDLGVDQPAAIISWSTRT